MRTNYVIKLDKDVIIKLNLHIPKHMSLRIIMDTSLKANMKQQNRMLAEEKKRYANFPKSSMPLLTHSFHPAHHTYRERERRKERQKEGKTTKMTETEKERT